MKDQYLNADLCRRCGGRCCKTMPGSYFPEDFSDLTVDGFKDIFKGGKVAIDWWEGDAIENDEREKTYYLRPAIKGVDDLFHPTWGGECIFLTEDGCKLDALSRPRSCRLLEPREDQKCVAHGSSEKQDAAIAWLPYEDAILEAVELLREEGR